MTGWFIKWIKQALGMAFNYLAPLTIIGACAFIFAHLVPEHTTLLTILSAAIVFYLFSKYSRWY